MKFSDSKVKVIAFLAAASMFAFTGCGALNNSQNDAQPASGQQSPAATESADDKTAENSEESVADDNAEAPAAAVPEKTNINIGYLNSTAHLLAFVASEEGYFKEEGLNVTLTQFSSAAELVNGLESDKLDIAFIGSVPTLTFQSQGHDVSIFGGAMTNGHG